MLLRITYYYHAFIISTDIIITPTTDIINNVINSLAISNVTSITINTTIMLITNTIDNHIHYMIITTSMTTTITMTGHLLRWYIDARELAIGNVTC